MNVGVGSGKEDSQIAGELAGKGSFSRMETQKTKKAPLGLERGFLREGGGKIQEVCFCCLMNKSIVQVTARSQPRVLQYRCKGPYFYRG